MKLRCLLLALVCTATLHAAPSPEEVANGHLIAIKDADWAAYTASLHPEAVKRFKQMMIPAAEAAKAADNPAGKNILERVFDNADLGKLKAASPSEFFQLFITNWSAKNRGFTQTMKNSTVQMLGHVSEGGRLAHAVYRMTIPAGNAKVTKVEVITLEKDGEVWKCQLTSELENLAGSLMRQLKSSEGKK
jgi:hypothetical protein